MAQKMTFDQVLAAMVKATDTAAQYALEASHMALTHYRDHQDVTYVQRLHDAMKKDFLRRNALVAWACEFAPIKVDKGKFTKDHDRIKGEGDEAFRAAFDLETAFKTSFWEFKPEQPIQTYYADNIVKAFEQVRDRFHSDKKRPGNEAATELLGRIEQALNPILDNAHGAIDAKTGNVGDISEARQEAAA